MKKVIVGVAITGSVPRKEDNPAVPISVSEQVESSHEAYEAGATLVHIHVRNADQTPSSDPVKFRAVQEGIIRFCPGMIVQFSTGGRGREPAARGSSLSLRPDMASLSTGSVNFPTIVYENPNTLVESLAQSMLEYGIRPEIEIFDLSHLHGAKALLDRGMIPPNPHIQFVLGVRNAMPALERMLDVLLREASILMPNATWTAAGIGRHQQPVMAWALARRCDSVRTGLEDNIRVSQTTLARNNAHLVSLACETVVQHGFEVADVSTARQTLGLCGMTARDPITPMLVRGELVSS